MSGKHTPGPWSVDALLNVWSQSPGRHSKVANLSYRPQAAGYDDLPIEEVAANARLIAAMPDMYPLVDLLASLPITDRADDIPVFCFDDVCITHGHVRAARAAIAKARGQA